MNKRNCAGCYNDFYNEGNNPYNIKECWSFDKNKRLVRKYKISIDSIPNDPKAWSEVRVPPCYRAQRVVLMDDLPIPVLRGRLGKELSSREMAHDKDCCWWSSEADDACQCECHEEEGE